MRVKDIHTSHLLIPIRAVYSVVQHTMLLRSGNTNVITKIDQMVMFCLIMRRINLVRLILDFILTTINAERRRHATLSYSMFLTRVFIKAQLPLRGHKADNKIPMTMMKTFSALGLKPQAQEKEKEKGKKDTKKKDSAIEEASTRKGKSKLSKEGKEKKEAFFLILEERRKRKRRVIRLAMDSSSSLRAEDEVSAVGAGTATTLAAQPVS